MIDIDNPAYFQRLVSPFQDVSITPQSNDSNIQEFLSSPRCALHPFACHSKMKFEQYLT